MVRQQSPYYTQIEQSFNIDERNGKKKTRSDAHGHDTVLKRFDPYVLSIDNFASSLFVFLSSFSFFGGFSSITVRSYSVSIVVCLSRRLSVRRSVRLSVRQSLSPSVSQSMYLSVHQQIAAVAIHVVLFLFLVVDYFFFVL